MTFLPTRTKVVLISATALLVLAAGFLSSRLRSDDGMTNVGGAVELAEPMERPEFTLTSTDGSEFDFQSQTEGKTALLYFGFLNCPDVCPLHMSNIASALREMEQEDREKVVTVFVSVDPGRDSPEKMRSYLDRFDPTFIGLTGSTEQLVVAQRAAGVAVAELGEPDANGAYDVGHAAQVIAYGPAGPAKRLYPTGATLTDWQRDLPAIVRGDLQ